MSTTGSASTLSQCDAAQAIVREGRPRATSPLHRFNVSRAAARAAAARCDEAEGGDERRAAFVHYVATIG